MKVLFLLRRNSDYYSFPSQTENGTRAGLFNSANMTKDQLIKHLGVTADVRIVEDGNKIDREIVDFRPEICVLEALWATPDKLIELTKIHTKVTFIVRIHSEVPFIANETIAIDWIQQYFKIPNVIVAFNSQNAYNDFFLVYDTIPAYLPNIYEDIKIEYPSLQDRIRTAFNKAVPKGVDPIDLTKPDLHIGCFGAIRPMKNQLFQAFCAIELGNILKKTIHFHINASRVEHGGNPALINMQNLFANSKHELVQHEWLKRPDFLSVVRTMDLGMQLSFNESFNIVTADFVAQNVPMVVSESIDWMPPITQTSSFNSTEAIETMLFALNRVNRFTHVSQVYLNRYNVLAIKTWQNYLNSIHLI